MAESNINTYYEQLVWDLAERVKLIRSDYEKANDGEQMDTDYAVVKAIDEGFIYGADQAYVLARAFIDGDIEWGQQVSWDYIRVKLEDDIIKTYEDELK